MQNLGPSRPLHQKLHFQRISVIPVHVAAAEAGGQGWPDYFTELDSGARYLAYLSLSFLICKYELVYFIGLLRNSEAR